MMKKSLLFIILLATAPFIFAQSFDIGIKGGINSQKITTDTYKGGIDYSLSDLKSDAERGFNVGVFARVGGKKLYLQPEVLYAVKKGNSSFTYDNLEGTEGEYSQSFDLKSIQVPLLIGFKMIDFKFASLRIFTGPAMTVILKNSRIAITGSGESAFDPSSYDPKNFKNNVWDWQAGGGIDIGPFVFDVRYEWGLTNISDGDPTKVSFINKGNSLLLSLGFKFL